jgi:hypothetical protein
VQSLLVVQTVYLAIEHHPINRYNHGLRTALAFLLLAAAICVRLVVLLFYISPRPSFNNFVLVDILRFLVTLMSLIACLSIPRRPSVLAGNSVVDGQYTVSALSSYTFSFAGQILSLARTMKSLDLVDLPQLHFWGRSSYLLRNFGDITTKTDRLWKSVVFAHWPELLFQTAWAMMHSVLQFAPQLAMYQLLKLLEQRSQGVSVDHKAWGLVVALGASIILEAVSFTLGQLNLFITSLGKQQSCLIGVLL